MRRSGPFSSPDADEVIPGLHIGAVPSARAVKALARAGISYAVDLRADARDRVSWPAPVRAISRPLVEFEAPQVRALRDISGEIAALMAGGEVVYVHCREGIQRAPMIACAVLVQTGWTLAEAYRLVVSRRAVTSLSEAQLAVLRDLEADMTPAARPGAEHAEAGTQRAVPANCGTV